MNLRKLSKRVVIWGLAIGLAVLITMYITNHIFTLIKELAILAIALGIIFLVFKWIRKDGAKSREN